MRQSHSIIKMRKETPQGEVSKNATLLIRAGFIHKELSGVYSLLPLGLMVLRKIERIVREAMNRLGSQELLLTALQDPSLWQSTDRWSDDNIDVWFKTKLKNDSELGLGLTHEEPITNLLKKHLNSYEDLPASFYQFQNKFRNETRAKSGLIRGREFLMKDLYSFSASQEQLDDFYNRVIESYKDIFNLCGLGDKTYLTFASGGAFSRFSHEFQTISEAGEDIIYLDEEKGLAINEEVITDDVLAELGLSRANLKRLKSIEVGNIFKLGTRFSSALRLNFINRSGQSQPVIMGSYGLGLSRLLGTIAEVLSDEAGLVWPESVAPLKAHLLTLGSEGSVFKNAEVLYNTLTAAGIEVLFDDRANIGPGEKLATADLIGLPYRLIISSKTGSLVEVKKRIESETKLLAPSACLSLLS